MKIPRFRWFEWIGLSMATLVVLGVATFVVSAIIIPDEGAKPTYRDLRRQQLQNNESEYVCTGESRCGDVQIGMTTDEVETRLGTTHRTNRMIVNNTRITEFYYDKASLVFEDNALVAIEIR